MFGLAKIAKDSTLTEDFMAGIDPTGVNTFGNALKNKENHTKHQLVGDAGGFIGGALIGTLAPAALMKGVALGAKKFNPGLADEFNTMSKGTLDALNPKTMKRYMSSLGDLTKFKSQGSEVLQNTKKLNNLANSHKNGTAINPSDIGKHMELAKDISKKQTVLNDTEKKLSSKYFNGAPVSEGASRVFTAMSTAGAGALSGGLGAMGAHMQYNTGKRVQKMQEEDNNK